MSKYGKKLDTLQHFRQSLTLLLSALSESSSWLDKIREFLQTQVTNADRMNMLITTISEHKDNSKPVFRKEVFKVFGLMGEIFEDGLIGFLPSIFAICFKKLDDATLHLPISDSIGVMIHHIFKHIPEYGERVSQLRKIMGELFAALKTPKKHQQIGLAMSITRVIQNSPIEALAENLGIITADLQNFIKNPSTRCITELLESLISLVLAVESDFAPYVNQFIAPLMDCLKGIYDWTTRKMAIDVIYTFTAFVPNSMEMDLEEITKILKGLKTDKIKQVREAAQEALTKIQEVRVYSPTKSTTKKITANEDEGIRLSKSGLELARERNAAEEIKVPSPSSTVKHELEKISHQQATLIESLNNFQISTKNEISMMQERINYLEDLLERMSKTMARNASMNASIHTGYSAEEMPLKMLDETKQLSSKKEDSVWKKALEYINDMRYNEVYNWILGKKDDLLLIRLMGRTGVVIDQLDSQNVEYLLMKVIDLILSGEFVDLLLTWIISAVDSDIKLSLNIQSSLLDCLQAVLGDEGGKLHKLESTQLEEIHRVIIQLKASLSSFDDNLLT